MLISALARVSTSAPAMLTPYIGAGYHYWNRNLTGGFPLAYREEYEHGYEAAV